MILWILPSSLNGGSAFPKSANNQLQDFLFNNQCKTLVLVLLSIIELQIRHKLKALKGLVYEN
jgi:hypothetical protein